MLWEFISFQIFITRLDNELQGISACKVKRLVSLFCLPVTETVLGSWEVPLGYVLAAWPFSPVAGGIQLKPWERGHRTSTMPLKEQTDVDEAESLQSLSSASPWLLTFKLLSICLRQNIVWSCINSTVLECLLLNLNGWNRAETFFYQVLTYYLDQTEKECWFLILCWYFPVDEFISLPSRRI